MKVYGIVFIGLMITSPLYAQVSPYCAQFSDGSSPDCSYSSLQMCEQSVTGVGGICIMDPYGSGASPTSASQNQAQFNPVAVPPPPFAQQSAAAPIQSLSSDLALGGDPPATLGEINFSAGHNACIGLFGRMSCGGS